MDNYLHLQNVTIGIVCGGTSAEAEVSRISGRCIADALKKHFPKVLVFELNPLISETLRAAKVDVVYPALHGTPGEDGSFQGLLQTIGIPYVGSDMRASSLAMDKMVAKLIFRAANLPVAKDYLVTRSSYGPDTPRAIVDTLGSHVVVKPTQEGSALGVRFCDSLATIAESIEAAFNHFVGNVLVEKRILGKEITVGVIEIKDPVALPVIEITTPVGSWYDFEHRYTPGLSDHVVPAHLPSNQAIRIQQIAVAAHLALGCRDLSRSDFVVPEEGDPVLLETNTLPGMTPTSLYPDAAMASGMSFEVLVAHLISRALHRGSSS